MYAIQSLNLMFEKHVRERSLTYYRNKDERNEVFI